ncbi:hypothetical protein KEJ34_00110 [Candidatus Bathyarchaeota archaeon]|nr:hypothetical protein [Candidatus Bathyarchaeota archaeon]
MGEAEKRGFISFMHEYSSLAEVLADHNLASLGDAYVNLIYSLALSKIAGKPVGRKLDSLTLASALRKSDTRRFLPRRVDRHRQADAAEALIVYGWLSGAVSIWEAVEILAREGEVAENINELLKLTLGRICLKQKI